MVYYLEDNPNPNTAQYGWPRTWVSGVVGVHTTESGVVPGGPDAGAENTAGFISRRSDYGSYHSLADYDSRIRLTRPTFAAWADVTNNVHALSISGAMDAARWRDLTNERAAGIVRNMGIAAAELVQDAIAHGVLASPPPARRITAAEAIAGTRAGFYGHGETNPGTRYDPGTNFDWDLFLSTYAAAIGGTLTTLNSNITPIQEDIFMALSDAEQRRILAASDRINGRFPDANVLTVKDGAYMNSMRDAQHAAVMEALGRTLDKKDGGYIVGLIEATRATDPNAIAAALQGLIPEGIAAEVVDALSKRLAVTK